MDDDFAATVSTVATTIDLRPGRRHRGACSTARVSTGYLPAETDVRAAVADGLRALSSARRRDRSRLHPRFGHGAGGRLRRLRGRGAAAASRDRRRRRGVHHPEHLQGLRLRTGVRRTRAPGGPAQARSEQHRSALRLRDGDRAQRHADDEPDGQRRRTGDHEPRPRRLGRREVRAHRRRCCRASPGVASRWTRRSTARRSRRTSATAASPTCSTATGACTPIRSWPPTCTPASARYG